jgi:F0F1-type ATP synthase assembly protein I
MNQPGDPQDKNRSAVLDVGVALASQIGIAVVGIVLVMVFVGIWIDRTLDTKPIFTILLLLVSGPVSMVVVLRLARAAIAKIPMPPVKTSRGTTYHDEGGQDE